jgi:hypothetical protein
MIRKKFGCYLAAVLLVGVMQACGGGGGGGGDVDTTIDVTGSNAPTAFDAAGHDFTFTIATAPTEYVYTIANFGKETSTATTGDKLIFPTLPAGANVIPDTDECAAGKLGLPWALDGNNLKIVLTGVDPTLCRTAAFGYDGLNAAWGNGWIKYN